MGVTGRCVLGKYMIKLCQFENLVYNVNMNKKNNKQLKKIPQFKSEEEERGFWEKNDSADFIDWEKAKKDLSLPKLKPSTKTISLRIPVSTLNKLKEISNRKDIPYQSYIKIVLDEKI